MFNKGGGICSRTQGIQWRKELIRVTPFKLETTSNKLRLLRCLGLKEAAYSPSPWDSGFLVAMTKGDCRSTSAKPADKRSSQQKTSQVHQPRTRRH